MDPTKKTAFSPFKIFYGGCHIDHQFSLNSRNFLKWLQLPIFIRQ